jgi:hypothetical protein
MTKPQKNLAASVHGRLKNHARDSGRPFQEVLQYFVMERFLYRLSVADTDRHFVLKGGLMLQFWGGRLTRATRDIDLHHEAPLLAEELVVWVQGCLRSKVEADGLIFDPSSVEASEIRLGSHYKGIKLRFQAGLGKARIRLQVDVGFGDAITPSAVPLEYPSLLGFPPAQLQAYTPETAIAEKFEAMVALDMANSRMKDFFDLWVLLAERSFDGRVLAAAIRATFARRQANLPPWPPVALSARFSGDADKKAQWKGFVARGGLSAAPPDFTEVIESVEAFLRPVADRGLGDDAVCGRWSPGGPWSSS